MRTHYGPWQPCWISNQHQKHKSGRGPSSEHFWQVCLISVQRFQRRRFKCEKLTDGRTLTHDKSSHGLWPGELKKRKTPIQCPYSLIFSLSGAKLAHFASINILLKQEEIHWSKLNFHFSYKKTVVLQWTKYFVKISILYNWSWISRYWRLS